MDVNNYVENFIKEFDIKDIDIYTLKMIISKLGYELVEYNPLLNNEHVNTIINGLNLKEELKSKSCFTYKSKLASYIFVRNSLAECELIYLLLHEIGHIYMHHVDKDTTDKSEYYEHEANKFADEVKCYINQMNQNIIKNDIKNHIKRKVLYTVSTLLLSALIFSTVMISYKKNESNEFRFYREVQETSIATTEAITIEKSTESETKIRSEPSVESDDIVYYVSSSGTKYHLRSCYQINPEKCTALTLKQIEEMGYTPCKTCKPDKQD